MNNKEDWEELENWSKQFENESNKRFGFDLYGIDFNKKKKNLNIFVKFTGLIYKFLKYFIITALLIGFAGGLYIAYLNFDSFGASFDSGNPKKNIEQMYNIKIKELSSETDEKGNGKYTFILKNNKNIIFTALKNKGEASNDFLENCHKYCFENWDSEYKNSFIINEKLVDGLLNYSMYIEINSYSDIDDAMKKIGEFVIYSEDYFYPIWKIYLKKENLIIYPYTTLYMSHEEATFEAKKFYLEYLKTNHINENISDSQFEKYLHTK